MHAIGGPNADFLSQVTALRGDFPSASRVKIECFACYTLLHTIGCPNADFLSQMTAL